VRAHDHSAARRCSRLTTGMVAGLAGFLTGVLLLPALAGCAGAGSAPAAPASPGMSAQQQARAVWLDYARCARSHGAPDFPDPQLDSQGRATFTNGAQVKQQMGTSQLMNACGHILGQLPASAQQPPPVSAAQLRQLLAFARCMRTRGAPGFPDPQPDGRFALSGTQKTELSGPVYQSCRRYLPAGGLP
jgi:hypothetical protein